MIIAIHQPESFPWLGFFYKMSQADKLVLFDTVQFEKNNFQNRNQIRTRDQKIWLTIPVKKHPLNTLIKDIEINWDAFKNGKKHLQTIHLNYSKCKYFNDLFPDIEKLYNKKHKYLADFNVEFISLMKEKLGISTELIRSSELNLPENNEGGTEKTLELCKLFNATVYISGAAGMNYLKPEKYNKENIKIHFQHFEHPEYQQHIYKDFYPYMSIIDLYCNHGPKSFEIITKNNEKYV